MTIKSKTGRRTYALTLLVAAIIIMSAFSVWPNVQASRLSEKLANSRFDFSGFDLIMAKGANLAGWNNLLTRSKQQSALLLPDATLGAAGAYLQTLILNHVAENGGNVSQVHVLPEIEKDELIAIPVSLNLTTNTKGLRDIIFDLETDEPLIFIRELVISPAPMGQIFSNQSIQKIGPLSLSVSMTIIGYMKKGKRP